MSFLKRLFRNQDSPKSPELEHAMNEIAKNDNAKTREGLYKAILASTFIVEGSVSGGPEMSDGSHVADENTRIGFKTVEHPPGHLILPIFTSVDALTSFEAGQVQWVALRAQELFQSIAASNIAEVRVNPFREEQSVERPGGIIARNEFMALAQGLLPQPRISDNTTRLKVAAGQKLLIGKPAIPPPAELLIKLTNYFQHIPELRGAYLFQMTNQKVVSTAIGLHFADEPPAQRMEHIMRGIGDVVKGEIPSGTSIDFMPLKTGTFLDSVRRCGLELATKHEQ